MSHQLFLEAFSAAFDQSLAAVPDMPDRFDALKAKTGFMVGDNHNSVLGLALSMYAKNIGLSEFSVFKEWYSLDLIAVSPSCNPAAGQDYWRTKTVATVEHENGYDVETEMWKLAHWQSPLSVLVFYDFDERHKNDVLVKGADPTTPDVTQADWLNAKLKLLSGIVDAIDAYGAQRHLLVIGNKNMAGKVIWRQSRWTGKEFSAPAIFA